MHIAEVSSQEVAVCVSATDMAQEESPIWYAPVVSGSLGQGAQMDHGRSLALGGGGWSWQDPCLRFAVSRVASSLHSLPLTEGARTEHSRECIVRPGCIVGTTLAISPALHYSHLISSPHNTCTPPSLPPILTPERGGQRTRTRRALAQTPVPLPPRPVRISPSPLSAVSLPPSPRPPSAHLSSSTSSTLLRRPTRNLPGLRRDLGASRVTRTRLHPRLLRWSSHPPPSSHILVAPQVAHRSSSEPGAVTTRTLAACRRGGDDRLISSTVPSRSRTARVPRSATTSSLSITLNSHLSLTPPYLVAE